MERNEWDGLKIGERVVCVTASKEHHLFANSSGDLNAIEVGGEYTVSDLDVHKWHTKIYFEELEGSFNSTMFNPAPKEEDAKLEASMEETASDNTAMFQLLSSLKNMIDTTDGITITKGMDFYEKLNAVIAQQQHS